MELVQGNNTGNPRINLVNGNPDGGGGMLRGGDSTLSGQAFGETRIWSGITTFGANNLRHCFLTLWTGDCNKPDGVTAPTGTLKQRVVVNGMGQVGIGVGGLNYGGGVTIGVVPSAVLQVDSVPTTILDGTGGFLQVQPYTGFLPPRLTTAQRDQIITPADGLVVYNTTTSTLNVYAASTWKAVTLS